jgi:hypothetical protein
MDSNIIKNTTYANCRVSRPVLYPNHQIVSFNGFAWSPTMGMVHETTSTPNESWQQWLGTQQ